MAAIPRKWVIILPVIVGIAALLLLKQTRVPPIQEPLQERPKLVRVITVPSVNVSPKAKGHGSVRPSRTWEAVAQVKGKIVVKHAKLQKGAILEADTLVLRIDPTDYELAIAQTDADIQAIQAQLQELDARAANSRASLKIEQAALALNKKELERKRKLVGKGSVSRSDLEGQERALLAQQQTVQAQKNTLNLIPSQQALLQAQLAQKEARLAAARRDLAHTEVRLPFTGRIAEVHAELDQYVREGELLTLADDLQMAEVEAQIPIDQMGSLIHSDRVVNVIDVPFDTIHDSFGLKAKVRLKEGGLSASWDARFARLSDTLDPKTRTIGVIVEVDAPYAKVTPGVRPPLFKGLFVEVDLVGKPRAGQLIVPRYALHDSKVYVANRESRLEIRNIQVTLLQPEFAVIGSGLNPGEQIVVSDLVPAVEGMLLKPLDDERSLKQLIQQAGGD